ncbi:MAG: hypothetical protein P8179_15680 [Candidatus Thiodiazotropha sp.]
MSDYSIFRTIGFGSLVLSVLLAAGCELGTKPSSPEGQVKARAEAYWAAMLAKDYVGAYAHLAPGFRAKVSDKVYAARFAGKTTFRNAEINKIECAPEVCDLVVDTKYTVSGIPPFNMDVDAGRAWKQRWILFEGDWWLLPDK